MQLPPTMTMVKLIKRYKRFLADVELADGTTITIHTANTGRMLGCSDPGSRIWMSRSDNPKRRYAHTWEIVEAACGTKIGINTLLANRLVLEAIENGVIKSLQGYDTIRREVPFGVERSRVDLLLEGAGKPGCYVEVKNVTAAADGVAFFPDAVTVRGRSEERRVGKECRSRGSPYH